MSRMIVISAIMASMMVMALGSFAPGEPPARRPAGPIDRQIAFSVTYRVADMVVRLPPVYIGAVPVDKPGVNPPDNVVDFDALIEFIESTVKPSSWAVVGGPGSINPSEKDLSIIVNQTQDVHKEIAGTLERFRRLQDSDVRLNLMFLNVAGKSLPAGLSSSKLRNGVMLRPEQLDQLLAAAGHDGRLDHMQHHLTVQNGQEAWIGVAAREGRGQGVVLRVLPVIPIDQRHMRLTLLAQPAVRDMAQAAVPEPVPPSLDAARLRGPWLAEWADPIIQSGRWIRVTVSKGSSLVAEIAADAKESRQGGSGNPAVTAAKVHRLVVITPQTVISK